MNNLIIKLKGGTGNQLFQAAFAYSLAKKYKKNCKYSDHNISNDKYNRKLEISPLLKKLSVNKFKSQSNLRTLYLDQYDIDHPIYFTENSPLALLNNDIFLQGYFTNYRLHDKKVYEEIKTFIKNLDISKNFIEIDYIAIHLRELHGSGKNKISTHIDNLDFDYYSKCLNKIISKSNPNKIKNAVVFCDTWKKPEQSLLLPKIKTLLHQNGIKYINGDSQISSSLDLLSIFSHAQYCVISNSTLSWWGAYLSNSIVFSPIMNLWEPNLKIPDHWEQIYSNEIMPKTHHKNIKFKPTISFKKSSDYKIYNYKRLKLINITRFILTKINSLTLLNNFKRCLNSIGILPENPYKTFI